MGTNSTGDYRQGCPRNLQGRNQQCLKIEVQTEHRKRQQSHLPRRKPKGRKDLGERLCADKKPHRNSKDVPQSLEKRSSNVVAESTIATDRTNESQSVIGKNVTDYNVITYIGTAKLAPINENNDDNPLEDEIPEMTLTAIDSNNNYDKEDD